VSTIGEPTLPPPGPGKPPPPPPIPAVVADGVIARLGAWPSDWIPLNQTQLAEIHAAVVAELEALAGKP
jgi:hypothetical protein